MMSIAGGQRGSETYVFIACTVGISLTFCITIIVEMQVVHFAR